MDFHGSMSNSHDTMLSTWPDQTPSSMSSASNPSPITTNCTRAAAPSPRISVTGQGSVRSFEQTPS